MEEVTHSLNKGSRLVWLLDQVYKDGDRAYELVHYLQQALKVDLKVPSDAGVRKQWFVLS